MKNILAFDVGTTSMKCILFNETFEELFCENIEYSIETSQNGIAELDSEVYFETFCRCIKSISKSPLASDTIDAICFTTQGETLIPMDASGKALTKAIVWLDNRAEEEASLIQKKLPMADWYAATGLCGIDGALPLAKVLWLKNHMPHIYDATHAFLLLEDFLIYRLTGQMVSEQSLQSSTGWYHITNNDLYEEALDICGIAKEKFPKILPCGSLVGSVNPKLASDLGLSPKTVVVTGAMDQIASAIGAGNISEGMITETTGTALVVGATVQNPVFDLSAPLTVYKHYDNQFIYMPYSATAGIVLKWFRDTVMPETVEKAKCLGCSSYSLLDELAEKSSVGSNGTILNPDFSNGGAWHGLKLSTTREDMTRSVLEGVAYMLRELMEAVEKRGANIHEVYSLGGGSHSPLWSKIKASVCGKQIHTVSYSQTTALGAAVLASVALGVYPDVKNAVQKIQITGKTYEPVPEWQATYQTGYKNYLLYKNGGK